ncbi:response regulator, partial [Herbaspirillum sp. RTI4]
MQKMIRVIIADDHPTVILGISHLLAEAQEIDIVGTASNSTELTKLLETRQCDVLLSDYAMPGGIYGDGVALLTFIRRRYPKLKTVIMTMIDNPSVLRSILKLNIKCVLSKSDDPSHVICAVFAAFLGKEYLSPAANQISKLLNLDSDGKSREPQLTKREVEVIRLFVSGLTVNEIAASLLRSKQTVSSQKASAMKKLGIQRDADLY